MASTDKYTSNPISDYAAYENLSKFDGFYNNRYFDPMVSGYGFIFITRPQLYIAPTKDSSAIYDGAYNNMLKDPYFAQFISSEAFNGLDKFIPMLLSYKDYNINADKEFTSAVSSFLPMFTNKLKNIETNDVSLESTEAFETKQGYRMPMPTHTTQSEATSQVTLSVTESSNMDFTKLMTLWVRYINYITDGTFDANPDMIRDGVLDYTSSIYYFALEPDGRTLKYWCKYTGCWPTTIPYSAMRYNKGDTQPVELDIPFIYTVKEDLLPGILEDFNIVSLKLDAKGVTGADMEKPYQDIASNRYLQIDMLKNVADLENLSASPYITVENVNGKNRYILLFNNETNDGRFFKDVFKGDSKKLTDDDVDRYYFAIDGDDNFFKF